MPSSVIARMHYDARAAILEVIFVSGTVYQYRQVPPSVYEAMKAATSKGSFLNKHIKGNYAFQRMS